MDPPPAGTRLTLITDVSHTPYSGMLPAYVAGFYAFDQCHIDLRLLSQFANAVMILDRAIGLDLQNNRVLLANHPPISFDWLSIDIGSTPATLTVPGATDTVIPVKPISKFLTYWEALIAAITTNPNRLRVAIVGGGAGGVELTLAIQAHLQQLDQRLDRQLDQRLDQTANQPIAPLEIHLLQRGDRLIPERPAWVGHKLHQILIQRGVTVYLDETVVRVSADQSGKQLHCESGLAIECDHIFWVTQAGAADWLTDSGLATDDRGFVWVNDCLQSVSHPRIFATGDVASMVNHPRPKAGVFAVRQGKPLVQNLRRALTAQPLRSFVPQKEFLILIGTADRSAIASRGAFGWGPNPLFWRWKDWIDRKFMAQFSDLKAMSPGVNPDSKAMPQETASSEMRCAGCGSKVGSRVMERALSRIQDRQASVRSDILIGLEAADDAAVLQIPTNQVLVQTVDHFRALVNDPFVFGQICTHHCLSDLFAMGASPQSALAIVTLPYGTAAKLEDTLFQLLSGTIKALSAANAVLVGGHTTEGTELTFGLSCNGLADPAQLWRKSGMQSDQALILTKALGTGTLFAAEMQLKAKGRWIESAIESMLQSNQAAVAPLRQFGTTACTDVTGFGLAGHLLELMRASQVSAELDLKAIPLLAGAQATLEQGIVSSLYAQNFQAAQQQISNLDQIRTHPLLPILFDPQTSGGLLAAVPVDRATACVEALRTAGYSDARVIGRVLSRQTDAVNLSIKA